MGWQSYVLFIKNKEEENRIISIIKEHNELNDDRVGETLSLCVTTKLLKSKPKKFSEYDKVILCGNGGGRHSTFNWFRSNDVLYVPFTGQKWLSKRIEKVENIDKENI